MNTEAIEIIQNIVNAFRGKDSNKFTNNQYYALEDAVSFLKDQDSPKQEDRYISPDGGHEYSYSEIKDDPQFYLFTKLNSDKNPERNL